MERSTIYYLKRKGWSNIQIATALGCHRDTVGRILREPVDYQGEARQRASQVAVYAEAIRNVSITMGHRSQNNYPCAGGSFRQSQRPASMVRGAAASRAAHVGKQPPTLDPACAPDSAPVNAGIASVCVAVSAVVARVAGSGGLIHTASGTRGGMGMPLTEPFCNCTRISRLQRNVSITMGHRSQNNYPWAGGSGNPSARQAWSGRSGVKGCGGCARRQTAADP